VLRAQFLSWASLDGSGEEADIETIADTILQAVGRPMSLKTIVPDRPSRDRRYLLNSGKPRPELGWAPRWAFSQGVREIVAWYREHQSWWEPLVDRAPNQEDAWHPFNVSSDYTE
jgi:dTDP-glucose 4,6-dehydratase